MIKPSHTCKSDKLCSHEASHGEDDEEPVSVPTYLLWTLVDGGFDHEISTKFYHNLRNSITKCIKRQHIKFGFNDTVVTQSTDNGGKVESVKFEIERELMIMADNEKSIVDKMENLTTSEALSLIGLNKGFTEEGTT